MPEFVLVIIAALIGLLAGYLARGIQAGGGETTRPFRKTTATQAPQTPAQVGTEADPTPTPPAPVTGQPTAGPDHPWIDPTPPAPTRPPVPVPDFPVIDVAREVLEVADHVGNPELARRLVEAVVLLPEVSAVRPGTGDGFQPLLHEWAGHRITDQRTQWDTIAETLAPGAITAEGALLRPAHVIVFESPEES
jgi:hypothetical protein